MIASAVGAGSGYEFMNVTNFIPRGVRDLGPIFPRGYRHNLLVRGRFRCSNRPDSDPRHQQTACHHAPHQGEITMALATEDLKSLKSDLVVDARATSCPGLILAAKKVIGQIPVGGVMEVIASDTGTLKDLPPGARRWATS